MLWFWSGSGLATFKYSAARTGKTRISCCGQLNNYHGVHRPKLCPGSRNARELGSIS
jgi:hypothetical protein